MRPKARTFAEQWLYEHAAETEVENASAKDLADRLIASGEAEGFATGDFDDDEGRLFEMILDRVGRKRN